MSTTECQTAAKTPRAKKRRLTPLRAAEPAKRSRATTQPRSQTSNQLHKSAAASSVKASKRNQSTRESSATKIGSQPSTPNGKHERSRNKGGRATSYTEAIGAEILERLSGGESLSEICQSPHLPKRQTVAAWVYGTSHEHVRFRDGYARARELLLDFYADEIIRISRDSAADFIERERRDGVKEMVYNREHVERSKLRIDVLKWLLSKLAPKRYGDRQQLEVTGQDGGPVQVNTVLEPHAVLEVARLWAFRLQQAKDAVGEGKLLELEAEAVHCGQGGD